MGRMEVGCRMGSGCGWVVCSEGADWEGTSLRRHGGGLLPEMKKLRHWVYDLGYTLASRIRIVYVSFQI